MVVGQEDVLPRRARGLCRLRLVAARCRWLRGWAA